MSVLTSVTSFLSATYQHLSQQVKLITASSLSTDVQKILGALTSNTFTGEIAGQNVAFNYSPSTGDIVVAITGTGDTITIDINPTKAFGVSATWTQALAALEADLIKVLGEASPLIPLILAHFSSLSGVIAAVAAVV
jgi:hypothetical protein